MGSVDNDDGIGLPNQCNLSRLRWPIHQPNMVSFLSASLSKESFADVTLVSTEGSRIRAHRVVLSSCSSYFEEIFLNNPSDHPVVILKDVEFLNLQAIINFIYNGELHVDHKRARDIVKTASTLRIKFLSHVSLEELDLENGRPVEKCASVTLKDSVEELSSPIVYSRTPSPSVSPTLTAPSYTWRPTTTTGATTNDPALAVSKPVISKKSASADNTNISDSRQKTEGVTKSRSESSLVAGVESSKSPIAHQEDGTSSNSKISSYGSNDPPSFVITTRKKKEVWLDPDAIPAKRSQQKNKRLKQTSLFSLALRIPQSQTKVDLSKTKDYNGGSRAPSSQCSQTTNNLSVQSHHGEEQIISRTGIKRKSEESVEGDEERDKWETPCLDLSETFHEVTSNKDPCHSNKVVDSSRLSNKMKHQNTRDRHKQPRSPLSPGKMNIIEPIVELSPDKPKHKFSKVVEEAKSQFDSTLNILRDFDKIPECKPTDQDNLSRKQGKKKQGCNEPEECTCAKMADGLELCLDEREISRLNKNQCPIHVSGNPQQFLPCNTPENFWSTIQYGTQELYDKGLINVASPFTPVARRRRRNTDDSIVDTDTENDVELF